MANPPKVPDRPTVISPNAPTVGGPGVNANPEIDQEELAQDAAAESAPPATEPPKASANKGGRRPYDELLQENQVLRNRVTEVCDALTPLASLPDDPQKGPNEVLYVLRREGPEFKVLCSHIRAARKALGLM